MEIDIRAATATDAPDLLAFIREVNADPRRRCLQSDPGGAPREAARALAEGLAAGNSAYVVAGLADALAGALGCEHDASVGRGWLRGPSLAAGSPAGLAGRLLDALLPLLPSTVKRLDAFLDAANEAGGRFYGARGFRRVRAVQVYVADALAVAPAMSDGVVPLDAARTEAFAALHDATFPEGGVPGRLIAERRGDAHRVFVAVDPVDPSGVFGYVEVAVEAGGEGFIDHLGVDPAARGRGIGETLLRGALAWCFGERGVTRVGLTVDDERTDARRLYERAGFRLEHSGVNWRREGPLP